MRLGENLGRLAEEMLDLAFPPKLYCICCGNLIDETRTYGLCDHCIDHIRWNTDPPETGDSGIVMLSCCDYGIYERSIIFSLKYNGNRYVSRFVAEIMRDRLAQAGVVPDVLVPVPLHAKKERERGFNQAALIARHLARLTGAEFRPEALRRVRETVPMRALSPTERRLNVEGSMEMPAESSGFAKGKLLMLIDDFYTTGSTAEEACRALSGSGASSCALLAFAAREMEQA